MLDPVMTPIRKDIEDLYSSGSESRVPATPEKEFEEADGQSDCSDLHTPDQQSKRRRLPTPSPVKKKKVAVAESDSDGLGSVERDSLFDETPTRKRGFKRPRLPWSLVKEWNLDEYDREVAYEEIHAIMAHFLDEAGSKTYIKPNDNAIAGWRAKQVSYFFHSVLISFCGINNFFCIAELRICQAFNAQYFHLSFQGAMRMQSQISCHCDRFCYPSGSAG
jgi:hypothetical protein